MSITGSNPVPPTNAQDVPCAENRAMIKRAQRTVFKPLYRTMVTCRERPTTMEK